LSNSPKREAFIRAPKRKNIAETIAHRKKGEKVDCRGTTGGTVTVAGHGEDFGEEITQRPLRRQGRLPYLIPRDRKERSLDAQGGRVRERTLRGAD